MAEQSDRTLRVGLVGAGFLAATRARCWRQTRGASIVAVTSAHGDKARGFAHSHAVPDVVETFDQLLERSDIDVVDLCVPNLLHRPMTVAAARAGKHVICTKPLSAYVGQDLDASASDQAVSRRAPRTKLEVAVSDAEAMVAAAKENDVRLCYGENWIYAPSYRKALELLDSARSIVLEMRGGESHSGSHSPYSKLWRNTGGGALLRLGSHPVGLMLHLKRHEGLRRLGRPILPSSVTAEVGDLSRVEGLDAIDARIATGWVDVENWGTLTISFDDGSKGVAWGSDNQLGGMESRVDLFASNCRLQCNLSPVDLVRAYAPDPGTFKDSYIMEKVDSGAGYTTPMPDEDWSSGQLGMIEAFATTLKATVSKATVSPRPVELESDGELGLAVTRVLYAAYVAADEGRRVELRQISDESPSSEEPQ